MRRPSRAQRKRAAARALRERLAAAVQAQAALALLREEAREVRARCPEHGLGPWTDRRSLRAGLRCARGRASGRFFALEGEASCGLLLQEAVGHPTREGWAP